ncbi:MAG: hypothetical protein LUF68_07150 [Clostridiales bacterium]|nr:hypothetical protein [Clostridiales bacterium]
MGKLIDDIAELCTGDLPVEDWDGNCNEYTNITLLEQQKIVVNLRIP